MNRIVKIILGLVAAIVLAGLSGGVGYTLGQQAGAERSAKLEQFIAERLAGGASGTASFTPGAFSRQGNSSGGGNPTGGPMLAGRGLTGVVGKVSDDSIELTLRNQVLTVTLTAQTLIYTSAPATRADLKPGDTVMVTGDSASDGALTARSIQVMASAQP